MKNIKQSENGATDINPYVSHQVPDVQSAGSSYPENDSIDVGHSSTPWEARVRTDVSGRSRQVRRMNRRIDIKPGGRRMVSQMADHNGNCDFVTYKVKMEEVIDTLTDLAAKRDDALPLYISAHSLYADARSEADNAAVFSGFWFLGRQASKLEAESETAWWAVSELDFSAKHLIRLMFQEAEPDADPEEVKRELLDLYLGDYADHHWYVHFNEDW